MNVERAFEILSKDIEEIEDILSGIQKSSLPDDLEMSLTISKLRNLKENFSTLSHTLQKSIQQALFTASDGEPEKTKTKSAVVEKANILQEEPPADRKAVKDEELPPTEAPPVAEPTTKPVSVSEEQTSPKQEKKEKPVFLSDTFDKKQAFRNESLGKAHPRDVSSTIKNRPLSDLHRAIGLNEKFMFIRDLFDGDSKKYEETVQFINKAVSREQVNTFLSRFQWDEKKEAVHEFRELVERKLKSLKNG